MEPGCQTKRCGTQVNILGNKPRIGKIIRLLNFGISYFAVRLFRPKVITTEVSNVKDIQRRFYCLSTSRPRTKISFSHLQKLMAHSLVKINASGQSDI